MYGGWNTAANEEVISSMGLHPPLCLCCLLFPSPFHLSFSLLFPSLPDRLSSKPKQVKTAGGVGGAGERRKKKRHSSLIGAQDLG